MNTDVKTMVPESLRCTEMTIHWPHFDLQTGRLVLGFSFDNEEPIQETIVFPGAPFEMQDGVHDDFLLLDQLLCMLAAISSTSYYKARLPRYVHVCVQFDRLGIDLIRSVFRDGLGEFAFLNGLSIDPMFEFEPVEFVPSFEYIPHSGRWLVAIGGGKDSVVAMEMLKQAGQPAAAACVGVYEPVRECAAIAGLELIEIERRLAPELAEWNEAGAPNGHVPVTAIHSLILLIASTLRGERGVVMANERSADEPTRSTEDGRLVNHQYSKSFSFEQKLRAWLAVGIGRSLNPEIEHVPEYFSLLRPLSELEVCRRFAGMPEYHAAFVSCNAAYRRDHEYRAPRWCGDCPKCRFVFLGLAPFMRPSDLVEIFGRDLLRDESQTEGFLELLSPEAKPFECVGTRAEVRAAFGLLVGDAGWREAPVVRAASEQYGITPFKLEHAKGVLSPSGAHAIPAELASKLGL